MDKNDKPVWEEFPPSKYNCSLSRYTFYLTTDPDFYDKYKDKEKLLAKAKEAVEWVCQFPEVSML